MLRERWEWDTGLRKIVKVMAIQKEEDPITIYVEIDEDSDGSLDGMIVEELDENLMSKIDLLTNEPPNVKMMTRYKNSGIDSSENFIDKLFGSDKLRDYILSDKKVETLMKEWEYDEEKFKEISSKFLLY